MLESLMLQYNTDKSRKAGIVQEQHITNSHSQEGDITIKVDAALDKLLVQFGTEIL